MSGGLVGGFGTNLAILIVTRVLIGVGTSAGYPSAMVLIRRRATEAGLDAPPGGVLGGLAIASMATPSARRSAACWWARPAGTGPFWSISRSP
jgi:MFS family permease